MHPHSKLQTLLLIALAALTPIVAFAQSTQNNKPETLTVKDIRIDRDVNYGASGPNSPAFNDPRLEITWVDEKGTEGVFKYVTEAWLENPTFNNVAETYITVPKKYSVTPRLSPAGSLDLFLSGSEKFMFEFKTTEKTFSVGIGLGSKLVVQKGADGKYTLLGEETQQLSPAP